MGKPVIHYFIGLNMKVAFSCLFLALVCATSVEGLHCWAVSSVSTNQWCWDNCYHTPYYCPTSMCDCNCHMGDPGCPLSYGATHKVQQTRAHIKSLKTKTSFKSKRG